MWPAFENHSVPTGAAIAALGFAAVVMTFRGTDISKTEQIVWVLIAFLLLFVEIKVIEADRAKQDSDHRAEMVEQQKEFGKTLRGLKDTEDALTGGDSYDVITPIPVFSPNERPKFVLMISVRGKNPLWDVVIEMEEGPINTQYEASHVAEYFAGKLRTTVKLGAVSTTYMRPIGIVIHPSKKKTNVYLFSTWSRVQLTREEVDLRFNERTKRWETAWKIYREDTRLINELQFGATREKEFPLPTPAKEALRKSTILAFIE
jgi:hypothetical protein